MVLNIALDGTAGSGKGSVAREVAKRLDIYHLDSGAIFRTVAYKCGKEKIDSYNESAVCKTIKDIDIKIVFDENKDGEKIQKNILDGKILLQKCIRKEKISKNVSIIAQYSCVRSLVKSLQHNLAKSYNLIIEGRDITTDILPNADVKFFLTAKAEERARRRLNQLNLPEKEFENVLNEIVQRDKRDMERKISPLRIAKDAHYIDNTNDTLEETVDRIIDIIKGTLKAKKSF